MVATLILFIYKWLFHHILCHFSYGFELQLGGAVEISPRVLAVLKPALVIFIVVEVCHACEMCTCMSP